MTEQRKSAPPIYPGSAPSDPEIGQGRWVRFARDGGGDVYARLRVVESGRVEIAELHISEGAEPITARLLPSLMLGTLESTVLSPPYGGWLQVGRDGPGPEFNQADFKAVVDRKTALAALEHQGSGRRRYAMRPPTAQARYPDDFYERLARNVVTLIQDGENPAPIIAEASGVPVTTVHRWIREARRREKLPPARKGKAG